MSSVSKEAAVFPSLHVDFDGRAADDEALSRLASLSIRQCLSTPTRCELRFADVNSDWLDRWLPEPGSGVRIRVDSSTDSLFKGQITAVEHSVGPSSTRSLIVRAYDPTYALRKQQPVRPHVQLTVEELASELVAGIGLSVRATESGPLWPKLVQWSQSDLQLLTDTAARAGLYYTLRNDVLHLITLEGLDDGPTLDLGDTLIEARVDVNSDPACDSVTTLAWDPWNASKHQGSARTARSGRTARTKVSASDVGGTGERIIVDRALQDASQAEALAQGELDRRVGAEVSLWAVAEGSADLRAGTRVEINGLGRTLDGRYVVTSVTHSMDGERGWLSEIDTTPPPPRRREPSASTTLASVTQSNDPDGLGRVRVCFPTYNDIESDWLEVLCAGAGKHKGLVALPDVDDTVLVIFLNNDPAQAVVLGGLYGENGPPDDGVEGAEIKRYTFVTPGGQRLQLDDAEQTLRAQNSEGSEFELAPGKATLRIRNGSHIELSEDLLKLHADTALEIEAPGNSIVIRASSIDFDRA